MSPAPPRPAPYGPAPLAPTTPAKHSPLFSQPLRPRCYHPRHPGPGAYHGLCRARAAAVAAPGMLHALGGAGDHARVVNARARRCRPANSKLPASCTSGAAPAGCAARRAPAAAPRGAQTNHARALDSAHARARGRLAACRAGAAAAWCTADEFAACARSRPRVCQPQGECAGLCTAPPAGQTRLVPVAPLRGYRAARRGYISVRSHVHWL